MPKKPYQRLKLLIIMDIMRKNTDETHGLTMAEILASLENVGIEAERKSVYEAFEALNEYGFEIHRFGREYFHTSGEFELPELKLLVDSVQASKFITHKKSAELIKKLENLASKYEAASLQRQVFVLNRIKAMNESIYYNVDGIHEAISHDAQISFQYFEWNTDKEKVLRRNGEPYVVSPWALLCDDENYYMIAYEEESGLIKHYRVDKMVKIKNLEEKRLGGELFAGFDTAQYSKRVFGMFGGEQQTVKLRCENAKAGIIIDRFGRDVMIEKHGEFFCVSVSVVPSPQFFAWIMSCGIILDAPEDVKNDYISYLRSAENKQIKA